VIAAMAAIAVTSRTTRQQGSDARYYVICHGGTIAAAGSMSTKLFVSAGAVREERHRQGCFRLHQYA
jgi:creatinine amidohydrolase/Fe(II)-dependent formamide hydrolase-like protein